MECSNANDRSLDETVISELKKLETVEPSHQLLLNLLAEGRRYVANQPVIKALPLTALNDSLRASILEGTPLIHQWPRLLIMALWGGISFALALKWFRWT